MNCIHCNEPGAHPGTRKCTDLQACHGRQEYARGVADERARVIADLRARAKAQKSWTGESTVAAALRAEADRIEREKP
jgi:hypothetical protein